MFKRTLLIVIIIIGTVTGIVIWTQQESGVELVGYGESTGWGGTKYGASTAEATQDVEQVIQTLFEALNTGDARAFKRLLTDDATQWWAYFDYATSQGLSFEVESISDPNFDGFDCQTEVRARVSTPGVSLRSALDHKFHLVLQDTEWKIDNPAPPIIDY